MAQFWILYQNSPLRFYIEKTMLMKTTVFTPSLRPPKTAKKPATTQYGNRLLKDDYSWLRSENWQSVMLDPAELPEEIRTHLEAENNYCNSAMADTTDLQQMLVREMRGRIQDEDGEVPMEDGAFAYFNTYRPGCEHPLYARRAILDDGSLSHTVEPLLDAEALAGASEYFDLGATAHSPDHGLLAYAIDRQGSEYYDIRIKDLSSGEDLPTRISSAASDMVWSADGSALFWVWRDENNRPREVRCHQLGTSSKTDECIYREEDTGFFLNLSQTSDRRFILIEANDHTTSEVWFLDASEPAQPCRCIARRKQDIEYHVDHGGGNFYILTNADGAEDFKIIMTPNTAPSPKHWLDLVPPKAGVRRLELRMFKNHLVRLERENALPSIVIHTLSDGTEYSVPMTGDAYALGLSPLMDFDTIRMRYGVSSPASPAQIYDFDMASKQQVLRKTEIIPSGHDPDAYCVERLSVESYDGAQVPVSLVYKKDVLRDGSAPVLLYGYGAYGITIPAAFSAKRLSLLDRGFIYAIAHVRGGEAKGHAWYTAAKGKNKPNTFHDYIAVAHQLIAQNYTAKGRIIAMGGSAGGLLVGAVMNMAPELFSGAIAAVPFVDVLNTMCDETLPLTPPEWPEWGNPLLSDKDFASIAAYSPYDNIKPLAYPPILATAGLTDPRVTYWEPAKWVAKLRDCAPNAGPYFLHTEMQAGHGGATGRYESLKTTALEYAFAIKAAGLPLS
jgi:oligopeptidase B